MKLSFLRTCKTTSEKNISVYAKALSKKRFLGTSHTSTLKDTSTVLPCPQKHGESYAKKNHTHQKRDGVCYEEKFEIANYPDDNILNKHTEIIAKC